MDFWKPLVGGLHRTWCAQDECREGGAKRPTKERRIQLWPLLFVGGHVVSRVYSEDQGHVPVARQVYSCVRGGGQWVMCCL